MSDLLLEIYSNKNLKTPNWGWDDVKKLEGPLGDLREIEKLEKIKRTFIIESWKI